MLLHFWNIENHEFDIHEAGKGGEWQEKNKFKCMKHDLFFIMIVTKVCVNSLLVVAHLLRCLPVSGPQYRVDMLIWVSIQKNFHID